MVISPSEVSLTEIAREAVDLVVGPYDDMTIAMCCAELLITCATVRGDHSRLSEVLLNLPDNAVKFPSGRPESRVEFDVRREGGRVVCYVHDNYCGIEPRHCNKVFGLFENLDANSDGVGVVLSVVQQLIEIHGGQVWVESEGPDNGPTGCFTIAELPQQ